MSHTQCWAVALGTLVLALSLGCSNQNEGERCDTLSGDEDCATGLVCTELGETATDKPIARCCPPEGEKVSDNRCIQRPSPPVAPGSSTSTGGSATDPEAAEGGSPSGELQGGAAGSSSGAEATQSAVTGLGGIAGAEGM